MATIFFVSSFVTVLLSVSSLTNIIFFQMGQQTGSDIDIIVTAKASFDTMVNLNQNPYAQNPFAADHELVIVAATVNPESDLTQAFAGLEIMNTSNIR